MATPSFLRTDTWVQSEDVAPWHSGKGPFLMTSLHWEDWILDQKLDLVVVPFLEEINKNRVQLLHPWALSILELLGVQSMVRKGAALGVSASHCDDKVVLSKNNAI